MGHGTTTSNNDSCGNDERDKRIQELEKQLEQLEAENRRLRESKEAKRIVCVSSAVAATSTSTATVADSTSSFTVPNQVVEGANTNSVQLPESGLTADQVERYSRQLILSRGLGGVKGQLGLLSSRVLVVGAGGIGSTCLLYLASSGVGHVGIVDFDIVEISNLHRQVIHSTDRCGWNKAVSACYSLDRLNPTIQCRAYPIELGHDNVMELVQQYDCVVDCSDNPKTRYLINDACVLANKPLVSGSAVGVEGQLTVYNHKDGPCYRCLYPQPSATSQGCRACSDAGVFGPVPGLIGILQASEAIKIITNSGNTMNNRLLMYDALESTFLTIKKPPKTTQTTSNCPVCGPEPTICSIHDSCESLSLATGPRRKPAPPDIDDELNMTCQEYNHIRQQRTPHVLLDVRVKEQFDLCHLDGAIHIPLVDLPNELHRVESLSGGFKPIYCICRRGINSIAATKILHEHVIETTASSNCKTTNNNGSENNHKGNNPIHSVRNIAGGLTAWQKEVDPAFPKY